MAQPSCWRVIYFNPTTSVSIKTSKDDFTHPQLEALSARTGASWKIFRLLAWRQWCLLLLGQVALADTHVLRKYSASSAVPPCKHHFARDYAQVEKDGEGRWEGLLTATARST